MAIHLEFSTLCPPSQNHELAWLALLRSRVVEYVRNQMGRLVVALLPAQKWPCVPYLSNLAPLQRFALVLVRMLPLLGAGEACDYSEIKMKIKELFDLHLTQNPVVNIVIIIFYCEISSITNGCTSRDIGETTNHQY